MADTLTRAERLARAPQHPVYEWTMAALAVVAVAMLGWEGEAAAWLEWGIWGIFVIDYAVRLRLAPDNRAFVRANIVDLVAIIPFSAFRIARIARLARLARAGTLIWRASKNMRAVLMTNGLGWVVIAASVAIVGGAGVVWAIDDSFTDLGDAMWWSVVTATTVGYGDLAPTHAAARVVAVGLMLIGIGTIGMLTGSIATYFVKRQPSAESDGAMMRVVLADGRELDLDCDQAEHVRVTLAGLGIIE